MRSKPSSSKEARIHHWDVWSTGGIGVCFVTLEKSLIRLRPSEQNMYETLVVSDGGKCICFVTAGTVSHTIKAPDEVSGMCCGPFGVDKRDAIVS